MPDFELSDFNRQNLVYEKEDLLISGPGKYPDYDFYRFSGVVIKDKKVDKLEGQLKPVNVKDLLP